MVGKKKFKHLILIAYRWLIIDDSQKMLSQVINLHCFSLMHLLNF